MVECLHLGSVVAGKVGQPVGMVVVVFAAFCGAFGRAHKSHDLGQFSTSHGD